MNKIDFKKQWDTFQIEHQPDWPNQEEYKKVINQLSEYPKIVNEPEIKLLKKELQQVNYQKSFVIQGGDCAETFKNFNSNSIKNKLKILLQMSAIIQYTSKIPVN